MTDLAPIETDAELPQRTVVLAPCETDPGQEAHVPGPEPVELAPVETEAEPVAEPQPVAVTAALAVELPPPPPDPPAPAPVETDPAVAPTGAF